jgi:hypothetical protein
LALSERFRFAVIAFLASLASLAIGCTSYARDVERICDAPSRSKYETKNAGDRDAQLKVMMEWAEPQAATPEGKALTQSVLHAQMYARAKLLRDAQKQASLGSCELADWVESGESARVR